MNSSVKFFAIIAIFMNGFVFGADIDNEARRDNEATIERLYNQYHEVHFYLSSYLSYFKSFLGRNVCDEREEFTDFFNQLDEYGAFVIKNGELESWLKNLKVSGHGSKWLIDIFLILHNLYPLVFLNSYLFYYLNLYIHI